MKSRMRTDLFRLAVLVLFFLVATMAYAEINKAGLRSPRASIWTAPTQAHPWLFQPWTAPLYFLGGYVTIFLPFIRQWRGRRFYFTMTTYAITYAVAYAIYLAWPMRIIRPDYDGPGLGLWILRIVAATDDPSNLCPSLHSAIGVLCALHISQTTRNRLARVSIWALALGICLTTITVGQHYFWDVPAGMGLAFLGYHAGARLFQIENFRV